MSIQVKVTGFDGTPKKIAAADVNIRMSANAIWYSSNASTISVNDILSNANADWISLQPGKY